MSNERGIAGRFIDRVKEASHVLFNADGLEKRMESLFYTIGSKNLSLDFSNKRDCRIAYEQAAPVCAIIGNKAKAFANGKISILEKDGLGVEDEGQSEEAGAIRKFLLQPNPTQTWEAFVVEAIIYKSIFGGCYIRKLCPVGIKTVKALYNLPPWAVTPHYTGKLFGQTDIKEIIKNYTLSYNGQTTILDTQDVLYISDDVLKFNNTLQGESRFLALSQPISNIIAAYRTRGVLLRRNGVGVLTSKSHDGSGPIPLKEPERKDIKARVESLEAGDVLVAATEFDFKTMSYKVSDFMLFEEIEDDILRIADAFGYPRVLLSNTEGETFSNKREGKKTFYQDTVIPEAQAFVHGLTHFLELDNSNLRIDIDFSHVEALQEGEEEQAQAMKVKNEAWRILWLEGLCTKNQWLEGIGLNALEDEEAGNLFFGEKTKKQEEKEAAIGNTHELEEVKEIKDKTKP